LGTIAARAEAAGHTCLLVTGDKDACQLATELTRIVTTKKGISEVSVMGPDEVYEKYGVTPAQFTDFLGLMGDSSDNIPGVPGIGPKTATKLLQSYGNIEGIYENIDKTRGKQRENLENNREIAYLSRQIATIVTDLDFELDLEAVSFPSFDVAAVTEAFQKYSLASPLARVLKIAGAQGAGCAGDTTASQTLSLSGPILQGAKAQKFLDTCISAQTLIGAAVAEVAQASLFQSGFDLAISTEDTHAFFTGSEAAAALSQIIESANWAVYDLKAALRFAVAPDTSVPSLVSECAANNTSAFDILLGAYVANSSSGTATLSDLAQEYLSAALPDTTDTAEHACICALACNQLKAPLERALSQSESMAVYEKIDRPLVGVLLQMERTGAAIDCTRLAEIGHGAQAELEQLSAKIYEAAGQEFNIDSPKQLSEILFDKMGIKPLKKTTRGYSTNAAVLTELAKEHEIARLVLRYRELAKINSTYIEALPKMRANDGRVHTQFHETVTATGRLSSSDPNLQNIPVRTEFGRQIRECFVPLQDGHVFLSADYSQIELRLLAHLSADEHLIAAFNEGADFHTATAARVFGISPSDVTPELRSRAKAVNFGIVYGQQAYGLSQSLDIPFAEAREMIERYFAAYPQVRAYLDGIVSEATHTGFAQTMYGRRRYIPELASTNRRTRGVGERTAMNHPMQGSAADIIKLAMAEVSKRLESADLTASLLLQVHDELDFSVAANQAPELAHMVKEVMENVCELSVPLEVDVRWGNNWAQAH
jgi:DNA polymerase-1